ncbi:hypothetical protein NDU88_010631 [Pleurodeles waltl]|uniref:Uncharacterized protein n=1 Tax=Pleurodeles waltl TaxID=8319 RepID=A0AAV7QV94_PLEWA|nr:hypothetical protein NDU88_010631 [Pleurodeles waltl]
MSEADAKVKEALLLAEAGCMDLVVGSRVPTRLVRHTASGVVAAIFSLAANPEPVRELLWRGRGQKVPAIMRSFVLRELLTRESTGRLAYPKGAVAQQVAGDKRSAQESWVEGIELDYNEDSPQKGEIIEITGPMGRIGASAGEQGADTDKVTSVGVSANLNIR